MDKLKILSINEAEILKSFGLLMPCGAIHKHRDRRSRWDRQGVKRNASCKANFPGYYQYYKLINTSRNSHV